LLPLFMVKRLGGSRHKTRYKLAKAPEEHGRLRITARLRTFNEGERVSLSLDSAAHAGSFHPRHHGKTGVIVAKQGRAYLVEINDKNKRKKILALPVHLHHV
jgi:large subunit ribosomal protein L21e